MKKRILGIILALAMIVSFIPVSVAAAEPSLQVQKSGDKVTMTYTVPNSVSVDSLELRISFDKTKLELNTIEWANISGFSNQMGTDAETGNVNGWFNGTWSNASPVKMPADLVLVTAEFTVKSGAHGSAAFTVTDLTMVNGDDDMAEEAGATDTGAACSLPITDPNAITATVAAPVKGQLLATTAEVADDAPYTVATENDSFLWFEGKGTEGTQATGSAKPSQVYTVRLTLAANEGESFDVASLNGKTNTAGWTIVTLGAPDAPTANRLWLVKIFQETGKAAALGGTVMISGQAMFGYTLTANTTGLNYGGEEQGTLRYQWKRNGDAIEGAEDRSYKLVQEDIGHNISVEVWNSNNTGSVTSTSAVFVQKALNGENPDAPTFDSKTANSITISYVEGNYEFACVPAGTTTISQDAWQDGKTFNGLMPNREYDIYARVKESETHKASPASANKLTVITDLGTADEELQAQLKRAVVVLNREYNGSYSLPVDVQGSLPNGWRVEYSKDNVTFSTSISSIRDVSESGKYYVKFINDDYKPYVADFDVKITPKDISLKGGKTIVTPSYDEPIYTGSAVEPTNLKLYWAQNKELVVGTDVTIAYSNNINRPNGTITVTAKADGNFTGSCPVYFTIRPMKITPTVAPIADVEYNGGLALKPKLDITYTGTTPVTTLVEGKDYTVSYTNNKEVGQATATVSPVTALDGTTNYTFVAFDVPFKITRAKFPGTTTGSMNVRSREITTNVRYRLPAILGVEGAEYGDVTTEGDLIAEAHLDTDGRTLIFSTRAKDADTEGKIKIEITQGTNYFADTFVLTVTAKDKEDADVSITDDTVTGTVTYGRTFTATASAGNPGEAAGSWTWESSDDTILKIVSGQGTNKVEVKAVKASTTGATLTAKYSSETHEGIATTTAYPVSQQPIAVAFIDLYDREYDGTLVVYPSEVDTRKMSIGGKFAGDDVSVIVTDGSYDKKDAGSRTAELTLELDGTAKDNYYLPVPTYTVENAQITPKGVTIGGATVQPSKIYDGTTDAAITSTSYTVDGAISGDKVSVDATSPKASYESKDVGTGKTVTFSGFSLTGDDAKNYKLTAQPTATANITKRTLTVTSITVADKTYDATTDAQITNITYGNIVSGDQVYAEITASFADANAGANKSVTFNVNGLAGKDAGNYELSSSPLPAATATIRKAQLAGAPVFGKITQSGKTLNDLELSDVNLTGIHGVKIGDAYDAIDLTFGWDDTDDTVIEANKAYGWTVTTTPNTNYETLTGSTVLYPVSTSYSDQVKKQSEEFEAKKRGELPEDELDFRDVYEDDYFFDAVQWAAENGITGGVGNDRFGPNLDCSRGQTMTFLWRASGEPEPDSFSTDLTDVKSGDYFYEAVLWAMEEGVTTGAGAGCFAPNATVTRGQFVTFLYRLAGASSDGVHPFADVPAGSYYEKAIAWAFAEGITRGTSGTTFSPDAPCTRAQIITFLYRYFNR